MTTKNAATGTKATTTKAATKKATKKAKAAKKADGLRKPQLRILEALAKSAKPLARKGLAAAAKVDSAGCTEWLGSADDAVRKANDAKHFPSLVTLGFVKAEQQEGEPVTYSITAAGRKALKAD